ncbi:hypothetical protein B0H16DRAFT_1797772 [Mycena metata]|uniref:Uncharacterized protein n=1 Tax=Mycena metata TaxID=1033252 RepID=A0AAD7MHW7_9AGAR|nr:hypothetical protein B0H16DRAFT_1797772 [Mycena metata]
MLARPSPNFSSDGDGPCPLEQTRRPTTDVHKELSALKGKIATLENTLADERARRAADARLAALESELKEHAALEKQRVDMKAAQAELTENQAVLKKDRATLKVEQAKLLSDKHAVSTTLKRSLTEMTTGPEDSHLKGRKSLWALSVGPPIFVFFVYRPFNTAGFAVYILSERRFRRFGSQKIPHPTTPPNSHPTTPPNSRAD